jgi:hypothetical protein
MTDTASATAQPAERTVPLLVWVLTAIFGLRAFITVVGAFLFAFPMGGLLGTAIGVILLGLGVAYLIIGWRMRFGERAIWLAAIIAQIINQAVLTVADLSLYGSIPPEDYAFIVVTVVVLGLLLVPSVRRFFTR